MKHRLFMLSLAALALSACTLSLAQDVTPPPGAELGSGAAVPLVFPSGDIDIGKGAPIFEQNCAPCHGAGGLGDGPQSSELPVAVAPIGDPQLARQRSPADWFQIVTGGNIDNFMPPFSNALSTQQRWDVLAYAYSFSWDRALLDEGASLYADHEADILAAFPNMSDQQRVLSLSLEELELALTSLADETSGLSTAEVSALASYIQARALGAASSAEVAPSDQSEDGGESASVEELATIRGQVSNGSGEGLPEDLEVNLHGFDSLEESFVVQSEVAGDGSFSFGEVELVAGRIYFASVDYLGLSYFSEFIRPDEGEDEFDISMVIYETTADTSELIIDRVNLVIEFPDEERASVVQLVTISNRGQEAVAPIDDASPLLFFSLPAEASNLAFEQGQLGERYLPMEGGFADLRAVLPGRASYQILFAYDMPYGRGLELVQRVQLDTQDYVVFVPDAGIEMEGQSFVLAGAQEIDGVNYRTYQIVNPPEAGDIVTVELSGPHPLGSNPLRSLAADDEFLYGLGALILAIGAIWLWLRRGVNPERILDQIVALDQRYADGEVDEVLYRRRREALKGRLRAALERKKS